MTEIPVHIARNLVLHAGALQKALNKTGIGDPSQSMTDEQVVAVADDIHKSATLLSDAFDEVDALGKGDDVAEQHS